MTTHHYRRPGGRQFPKRLAFKGGLGVKLAAILLCLSVLAGFLPAPAPEGEAFGPVVDSGVPRRCIDSGSPPEEAEGEEAGDLLTIGVPALRIISTSFLLAGFCIVSGSVFQALGHGVLSLAVSVVRQLIVLLPAAFVLARLGGLHVVWWSFPFAELFSTTLSALFLYHVYKKEVAPMREAK